MSRGLSSPQVIAAAGVHRQTVALIEAFFDSGTLRLAIAPWAITSSGQTYVATGPFLHVKEVTEASGSVEGMEFMLTGISPEVIAIATAEPYRGRVVRLMKAYLDADTNQTIGTAVVQFVGRMHSMKIVEKNDTCDVIVTAEHYEAALTRANPLRLNDVDQQRLYPGDLGCSLAEIMVEAQIIFPSKEAQKK